MMALIQSQQALLAQFGYNRNVNATVSSPNVNYTSVNPMALHTSTVPIIGLNNPPIFSQHYTSPADIGELGDKQGGSSRSLQHIEEFQQFVYVARLINIPFSGLKYMWSNKRCDEDNIQERIDHALGNIELFEACPFPTLLHKPLIGSDHAPLIYSTHAPQTKKRPCFCFESMWMTHDQC
ncbi:hypothetical protein Tco_0128891 [Tanacetum coccineum]